MKQKQIDCIAASVDKTLASYDNFCTQLGVANVKVPEPFGSMIAELVSELHHVWSHIDEDRERSSRHWWKRGIFKGVSLGKGK